jgi:hypothetical protein
MTILIEIKILGQYHKQVKEAEMYCRGLPSQWLCSWQEVLDTTVSSPVLCDRNLRRRRIRREMISLREGGQQ